MRATLPRGRLRTRRDVLRLGLHSCAAVVGASLLGCGGNGEPPTAEARDMGPLPRLRPGGEPEGEPGGTLRLSATPDTLDRVVDPLASAQLLAVDPRTGLVYGDIARDLEADGELGFVFTLRDEVRFHPNADGLAVALTAEDVRRDFAARAAAREFLFAEVIDSIEAPDHQHVVLRARAPFALLFDFLADPGQAAIRSAEASPVLARPLGAGPFIPGAAGDGAVVLGANQLHHRGGRPLIEAVTVTVAADERARLDAFGRGDLDVLVSRSPVADQDDDAVQSLRRPTRGMRGLALSLLAEENGPRAERIEAFRDQRVRRAVALALDRDALQQITGDAISGPVGPAFGADALPVDELLDHPLYQQNPAEAHALLEAASRVGLEFRLATADDEAQRALGQALERQLAAAGLEPRAAPTTRRDWERSLRTGEFEAILFEVPGLETPDAGLRLHTSVGLEGASSPWGYSNPVYDAAVRRVLTAVDPGERARRSREAQRELLDDVPALLPLSAPREHAVLSARLQGFEWGAYEFNDRYLSPFWHVRNA